jgi:hypothetical protein
MKAWLNALRAPDLRHSRRALQAAVVADLGRSLALARLGPRQVGKTTPALSAT